jgi:hypothetical protein
MTLSYNERLLGQLSAFFAVGAQYHLSKEIFIAIITKFRSICRARRHRRLIESSIKLHSLAIREYMQYMHR